VKSLLEDLVPGDIAPREEFEMSSSLCSSDPCFFCYLAAARTTDMKSFIPFVELPVPDVAYMVASWDLFNSKFTGDLSSYFLFVEVVPVSSWIVGN
jgi:hypothetical protein